MFVEGFVILIGAFNINFFIYTFRYLQIPVQLSFFR